MGLAVFLLVALIFIVIVGAEICPPNELEKCLELLQSVSTNNDLALATTKNDLQLVCRKLQEGVKCVDEHSSRCFNTAQFKIFDAVVSETRNVIKDLCVEGELQQDYLRYAPCFKNISTDMNKCAPKYKKMAELSKLKEEDKDAGLKTVCCALKDFTVCKHEHVIRDCGPTASQFLQRHMDRMSGSLINEHCVLYTYGTDSCSSADQLSTKVNENKRRQVLLLFLLLLSIFFRW